MDWVQPLLFTAGSLWAGLHWLLYPKSTALSLWLFIGLGIIAVVLWTPYL
jgi:hypothetical protein